TWFLLGEKKPTPSRRGSSHSASGLRARRPANPSLDRQGLFRRAALQGMLAGTPTGKTVLELPLDLWPFQVGDAVQHGIVETAVRQATMVAQQALAPSAELFDRPLGTQVAGGGFQLHADQLPLLERRAQQKELDRSVQSRAVLVMVEPGPADFGCRQSRQEIGEPCGADYRLIQPHGKDHSPALTLLHQRLPIPVRTQRALHVDQALMIGFGQADQGRNVAFEQRLQTQRPALQSNRLRHEHRTLLVFYRRASVPYEHRPRQKCRPGIKQAVSSTALCQG